MNYTLAFKYKHDNCWSNPVVDTKGEPFYIFIHALGGYKVGVHTLHQSNVILRHGGTPVAIKRGDVTWNQYFKKFVKSGRGNAVTSTMRQTTSIPGMIGQLTSVFMYPPEPTMAKVINSLKPISEPTWSKAATICVAAIEVIDRNGELMEYSKYGRTA